MAQLRNAGPHLLQAVVCELTSSGKGKQVNSGEAKEEINCLFSPGLVIWPTDIEAVCCFIDNGWMAFEMVVISNLTTRCR